MGRERGERRGRFAVSRTSHLVYAIAYQHRNGRFVSFVPRPWYGTLVSVEEVYPHHTLGDLIL